MPVISLPEFLGIQEAPQRPVFQRTRQIAPQSQWDRDMQVADAVTALRQQRPMSQIQAIQNEYDTISSNADKLRLEREATIQAEQAVSALAGDLIPENPDFPQKLRQFQSKFPLAMLDPRVQSIVDDSYRMYQTNQSKLEDYRIQAAEQGIPWSTVQSAPREKIASMIAQQKPRTDRSLDMREKELDFLMKQEKALREAGKDMVVTGTNEKGEEIYGANPEYDSLMKEINDRGAELRSAYRGAYSPPTAAQPSSGARISLRPQEQPKQIQAGTSVVPGMGASPASKTVGKSAPTTEEVPVKTYVDEIKSLDLALPGSARILSQFSEDVNLPIEARKEIVKKLADAVKNPPPMKHLDLADAMQARSEINQSYQTAKNNLDFTEMVDRDIKPAWTVAKKELEPKVREYAKENGVDEESVWRSIAGGKSIPIYDDKGVMTGHSPVSTLILGDDYMKENPHLKKVMGQIEKLHNREAPIMGRLNRLLGGESMEIINGNVLKEMAKEKIGNAGTSSEASPTSQKLAAGQKVQVGSATITKRE